MRFGTTEIIVILVIVLVLFGGSKLAGVGKALGTSVKDFKKEIKDTDEPKKDEKTEEEPNKDEK